jgi:hypothetical protein
MDATFTFAIEMLLWYGGSKYIMLTLIALCPRLLEHFNGTCPIAETRLCNPGLEGEHVCHCLMLIAARAIVEHMAALPEGTTYFMLPPTVDIAVKNLILVAAQPEAITVPFTHLDVHY